MGEFLSLLPLHVVVCTHKMVEAVDYASLPEFKPASEYNAQLLNNLRVFAYCDGHKLAKRIPVMSISGHVDSGKSTTLSLCLRELGVIEESVFEAVEKEVAEKAQANSSGVDPLGNIAKIVEKGKEAKERGITIETRVWRVYLTNYMRLKKGSAESAEARKLLEQPKWEYKGTEEDDLEVFCYKTPMDLIDCPGHKDFIHNTSAAIMETDTQIVLFPNSSGEATGQGEDPFLKMLDPKHSLSIAHAHLGFTSGNMMIFCISKSDMNWSLVPERLELLKTSIKKKVGIPNVVLLPISNTNKKAQNMVQKSEMPEFNFFKGVEANLKIPDWRNPKTQYKVTYHLNSVFDAIRVQSVIVSHREQYEGKGTMMQIKNVAKIAHGYVMIGVILNGALSKGDIVRSARWVKISRSKLWNNSTKMLKFHPPAVTSASKSRPSTESLKSSRLARVTCSTGTTQQTMCPSTLSTPLPSLPTRTTLLVLAHKRVTRRPRPLSNARLATVVC